MKVLIYGAQPEERLFYRSVQDAYGFTFSFADTPLTPDTVSLTRGFDALIILTNCRVTAEVAHMLAANGVRFLAARSAGTDHIDIAAVHAAGLHAANVPFYAPAAIAEHTVLLALTLLRRLKRAQRMTDAGNFTMDGLKGRQLGSLTAGVFGTGRIGCETIRLLRGFGCEVLAHDPYPNDTAAALCTYAGADALLGRSDIVFLHCPLTPGSHHLIGRGALAKMRSGAYLVNTARGGLVDAAAVLEALQSGRLAGFGFDVYEDESAFLRRDAGHVPDDDVLSALLRHENAYYTPHVAFYTDKAIESMIRVTLDNLLEYERTGICGNEVHA